MEIRSKKKEKCVELEIQSKKKKKKKRCVYNNKKNKERGNVVVGSIMVKPVNVLVSFSLASVLRNVLPKNKK